MEGESNLKILLQQMTPTLNQGEYVFSSVKKTDNLARADILFEFKEPEGITIITERKKADALGLDYKYTASWITLHVHSSLEAVGFTAAFSTALADRNVSCNVVAGYHHDHIFVNRVDAKKAMATLTNLSRNWTP